LKLLLSSKLEQRGGDLIEWPRQTSEIKPGDKITIVRIGQWRTQNNPGERSNLSNYANITGTVKSIDGNKLELSETSVDTKLGLIGSPLILYSNNYSDGITLKISDDAFKKLSETMGSKFSVQVPKPGTTPSITKAAGPVNTSVLPAPINASASDKQDIVTQSDQAKSDAKNKLGALFGNRGIGGPPPAFLQKSMEASNESKASGDNYDIKQIKDEIKQLESRLSKLEKEHLL
jgi:hypothetical protein